MSYKLYLMSVVCIVNVSVIKPSLQRPSTAQAEAYDLWGANDLNHVTTGSADYTPEWNDPRVLGRNVAAPVRRVSTSPAPAEEVPEQVPAGREMRVIDLEAEQEGSTNDRRESSGSDKIFVSVVPQGEREVDADQRSQVSPVGSDASAKGKESCCARFCALLTCKKN